MQKNMLKNATNSLFNQNEILENILLKAKKKKFLNC